MDEIYEKILSTHYDYALNGCKRTRTGLLCYTNKGVYMLKKSLNDSQYVVFEACARNKLTENGFNDINSFIISKNELPYAEEMGEIYTLEKYVPVSTPESTSINKMCEASKTLATLHRFAYGLEFESGRNNLFKLPDVFIKRTSELKKIRKGITKRKSYDLTDMIIKNNYDYFLNRAQEALLMLNESSYDELCKNAFKKGEFIHNGFKSGNFMINDNTGRIYIDSFSKCAVDIACKDVAYFLRRLMKNEDFDYESCKKILESYCSIRPISNNEAKALKAMLVFPWKFMSLCNEYYNKRRTCCIQSAYDRFERCVSNSLREEEIIEKLF